MRRYETIFILRPDQGESQIQETIKRFEGIVGAGGGETIETEQWGSRELAYRIKGERRGYYIRLDYAASAATMNEVERNLKLQDTVLRYLSVLTDAEPDVAKAREELETRRRHVAEAKAAAEARAAALAAEHSAQAAEAAGADTAAAEPAVAEAAEPAVAQTAAVEAAAETGSGDKSEQAAEQEAAAKPEQGHEPEGGGKQD